MAFLFRYPLTCSIPNSLTRLSLRPSRTMSSHSAQCLFQLKIDPLTGKSEWVVINEEDLVSENSSEPLLATTSYLDMLNDSRRNRAFREAIDKTVTKNCRVLDIGAGTGLLSMMAARAMGCPRTGAMITACESYLPMVKLMRKVLHLNGMGRNINVINKRSDELNVGVDISSRADVLVSEILDSELLGEGVIPTLQHAHDMLLVENAQTVPYKATTYGQLVESKFLWKLHDLYNNEAKALDNIYLVPAGQETILSIQQKQYAMHCDAIKEIKLLSEPFKIFEFDFSKRPDSHEETEVHIRTTGNGCVHAVVSWWVLQLDCEGTIFYSTAPKWKSVPFNINGSQAPFSGPGDWCDHWKQCVWFIPGKGICVSKDEEVRLHAIHDDISISYNLSSQLSRTEIGQHDLFARDSQLILSPERVAIYGDPEWRLSMLTSIKNTLQGKVPTLCVVADDSIFLTILVACLSKTSHIISLFPGLRDKGTQYLQAVAGVNGFSMDRVEVLPIGQKCLTLLDAHPKKVDLLIGEPFYYGNEGKLPWQNLRFWKEKTLLNSVLSEDAVIMPCKGILRVCAMSLPELWNSRRCLNKIEGFDHSIVNATLGACGDLPEAQEGPCLPYFVWQCGENKELSETVTVMEFDFSKPISSCSGKAKVEFTDTGICHGFVLWIDWVMDAGNSSVIATGPVHRCWKQGVKLLSKPLSIQLHGFTEIEAFFNASNGELVVQQSAIMASV